MAHPDFRIVFTDDTTHRRDSTSEFAQSSFVDPLCLKIEPGSSQAVSNSSNANSDSLELGFETINEPVVEVLPLLSDSESVEAPGGSFSQSFENEPDPLMVTCFKGEPHARQRGDIDSQTAATTQLAVPALSHILVSSSPCPAAIPNGENISQLNDSIDIIDNVVDNECSELRSYAQPEAVEITEPPQIVTELSASFESLTPTVGAASGDRSSSLNPQIVSSVSSNDQSVAELRSQHRKKTRCPICYALISVEDLSGHLKSHETSEVVETQRSRRRTTNDPKTFPCSECSFKANSTTELSEHLEQHEDEASGRSRPSVTQLNESQPSPASTSISSHPHRISLMSRPTDVPLVITLDDCNTDSENILQNAPVRIAQSQSSIHLQFGKESVSAAQQNSLNSTNSSGLRIIASASCSAPPLREIHQQQSVDLTLSSLLRKMACNVASNQATSALQSPAYQSTGCSIDRPPQAGCSAGNSHGTVILQPDIVTPSGGSQTSALPPGTSKQSAFPPTTNWASQSKRGNICDVLSGDLSTCQPPRSLLRSCPRPSKELRPDSPEEVLLDEDVSTFSAPRLLQSPREFSVIRLPPSRETSVICLPVHTTQPPPLIPANTQVPYQPSLPTSGTAQPRQTLSNQSMLQASTSLTSSLSDPRQLPSFRGSVRPTIEVQSSQSNEVSLVPTNQIGHSAAPPKTSTATNESQLSFLSRIERLIETNAHLLKSNSVIRNRDSFALTTSNSGMESSTAHSRHTLQSTNNTTTSQSTNLTGSTVVPSCSGSKDPAPDLPQVTSLNASTIVQACCRSTNPTLNLPQTTSLIANTIVQSRSESTQPASNLSQATSSDASAVVELLCTNSASSSSQEAKSAAGAVVDSRSGGIDSVPNDTLETHSTANAQAEVVCPLDPTYLSSDNNLNSTDINVHPLISKAIPIPRDYTTSNLAADASSKSQSRNADPIPRSYEGPSSSPVDINITGSPSPGIDSNSTMDQPTTSIDYPTTSYQATDSVINIGTSLDSDDSCDLYDPELVRVSGLGNSSDDDSSDSGKSTVDPDHAAPSCDPDGPQLERTSKNSNDDDSSDGETTAVDPNYVPPSRERLPIQTPDSVLDAIPSFEHWIRSKFVGADSDPETPRPENDCYICARKFDSHELLKEHRDKRYSELECCKCRYKTVTARLLKGHTNKHTRAKPYKCEECGVFFQKRGKYIKHFLAHRGDYYYKCDKCGAGFHEYTPYEAHVNKERNITPYRCVKCNIAFTAKSNLQDHKKRKHKRNAYTQCTVCKKILNKHWLAGHMRRHENKDVRKFLCEQCGAIFKSRLSLSRHVMKHTGERPHVCTYCGAAFKVPGALKKHERKHTGERPYKCDVCGKTFAFNTPYTYHLRTHTGERPYTCEYCGMTFAQPSPYAVHKRLHTGERPYQCKVCPAVFPSHAAVRNHMQTHANSENGTGKKRTRRTRAEMQNEENDEPTAKVIKRRKRRSKAMVSDSSDSESEFTEETLAAPAEPTRRSSRQVKVTTTKEEVKDEVDQNTTESIKSSQEETPASPAEPTRRSSKQVKATTTKGEVKDETDQSTSESTKSSQNEQN